MDNARNSKRELLKRLAYIAPVIVTLKVTPAMATIGSAPKHKHRKGNDRAGPGYQGNKKHGQKDKHQFFDPNKRFFGHGKKDSDAS